MTLFWSAILIYCCFTIDSMVPLSDYTNYACDYSYQFPEIDVILKNHFSDNFEGNHFLDDYGIIQFPNGLFTIRDYHNKWVCFPPLVSVLAKNGLYSEIHRVVSKPRYYDPRYEHIEGVQYTDEVENDDQTKTHLRIDSKNANNNSPLTPNVQSKPKIVNNKLKEIIYHDNQQESLKSGDETIYQIGELTIDHDEKQFHPLLGMDDNTDDENSIRGDEDEETFDLAGLLSLINPTIN